MRQKGGSDGMGELIIVAIRLVAPLSIPRWPLAGGLLRAFLDAIDVALIEMFGLGGFSNYAALDKALDTYYLSFFAYVSLGWEPLAKWTSIGLFAYRLVGVVLFEITQVRWLLLVFPNLFENFYFFYLIFKKVWPERPLTPALTAIALVALLIPKLAQEWLLHYAEAQPWDWTKRNVLGPSWPF